VSAPRARDGVLREDVPGTGEAVLLDRARGRVLALNAAAAAVWDLLDGTRDAAALARTLALAGEVDEVQARADVDALLARLAGEGFLKAP
jgi:hypothetical protein